MKSLLKFGLAAILSMAGIAYAADQADHASHHPAATAEALAEMSEGEVRKVDKDAKKITIRHGELKNLDMPPMTMVFQVKDPSFVEKVKQGDKVSFVAEKVGGQFTLVQIETKQ
jgi:Cu/Ag efflux protein CusF